MRDPLRLAALAWMLGACGNEPAPAASQAEPAAAKAEAPPPTDRAANDTEEPEPAEPDPVEHFSGRTEIETTVSGEGEGPYRFTAWWHKSRAKDWERELAPYKGRENLKYLEVGVFEGRSLLWMIENVLTHPTSSAVAVDIFMDEYEATYDANIVASGAAKRVTKMKEPSRTALRKLPLDSFDIIYIDGSHTADDVLADAVLTWDLLRVGGLVIFDDYAWTGRPKGGALPPELLPRVPIDAFITSYRYEIELVTKRGQVMLRKIENPCKPKDYCTPVGNLLYFWRDFELRDTSGKVLPISDEERALIETLAKAPRPGEVGIRLDKKLRESPVLQALEARTGLNLRPRQAPQNPTTAP